MRFVDVVLFDRWLELVDLLEQLQRADPYERRFCLFGSVTRPLAVRIIYHLGRQCVQCADPYLRGRLAALF